MIVKSESYIPLLLKKNPIVKDGFLKPLLIELAVSHITKMYFKDP